MFGFEQDYEGTHALKINQVNWLNRSDLSSTSELRQQDELRPDIWFWLIKYYFKVRLLGANYT